MSSSSSSISSSSINAESFVPRRKQLQWDSIPNSILICPSSCRQPHQITKLSIWVYDPMARRSMFDTSVINIIQHIPQAVEYLQKCFYNRQTPMFFYNALDSLSMQIQDCYFTINQHRRKVKELERQVSSFAQLEYGPANDHNSPIHAQRISTSSLAYVKEQHRNSNNGSLYVEQRVIQTTPEALAMICDEIQKTYDRNAAEKLTGGFNDLMELHGCQHMLCRDYLTKMHMLMDIERVQAYEDVKAYDMYSRKFECIEIPPTSSKPFKFCSGCNPSTTDNRGMLCAYHYNISHSDRYQKTHSFAEIEKIQGASKPSIVASVDQFRFLKRNLDMLAHYPDCDRRVIAYITVPGIAENRPLVAIGDLLRLRFGQQEEVIAEVGAVSIKTERVMLFLPFPVTTGPTTNSKYMLALTNPANISEVNDSNNNYKQSVTHVGRFDVRFGLFLSRAHDIFKTTMTTALATSFPQVVRILAPTPFLEGIQKKSMRRPQMGISEWAHDDLNAEQKHAVFDIVRNNCGQAPYCVYGPPGTGKTTTVCESIVQLLRFNDQNRLLVCAPSDAACDVIAKRLLSTLPNNIKMLRINWWARHPDSLHPSLLGCTPMDENGFFSLPPKEELMTAHVVICQCFVAGCLDLRGPTQKAWMNEHFTHCFIDESSQSFEFESLIPLFKVGVNCSIVLAGDPKQLGPSTRSSCASANGLSLSLQERLMGLSLYREDTNYAVITKLLDNYRSHEALLRIPDELFYDGSLRCKASSAVTSLCQNFEWLRDGQNFPLMAYDVKDGNEMSKIDTPSFYNMEECYAIVKIIKALLSSPNVTINAGQIAVITCFRAQVLKLRNILRKEGLLTINVGVVEDFQGQETSVVLISTVLTQDQNRWKSGAKSGLGFMSDPKRFNVAITRASALCVIVGKLDYLEHSRSYWSSLIEHIRRNGGITTGGQSSSRLEGEEKKDDNLIDYGIEMLISRVAEMKLLGGGLEHDRYHLAARGYFEDAPEWRICL